MPAPSKHRGKPNKGTQPLRTEIPAKEDPEQEIIIAVMGVTGTGKSYFIREASGISDVEVSSGLHSCTAEVQSYSFPYANVKITLVDTPGFNDTTKSDTEVLTNICAWMSSKYKKGKLLSGIIYLHRITDVRMDGSSIKYVKMFQRLCGPNALQNVLLTTTQWSNVAQEQGEKREGELLGGDFWGGLITGGAAVARFMGTRESGLELIDKLMGNTPKPLGIQDQMVEKNMAIAETEAGKFMSGELSSLHKKYQKELGDLKREILEAVKERDDLLKEILAGQRAQSLKKLKEAEAEKKLLADTHAELLKKLDALNEREKERRRNDKAVIAVASKDVSVAAHATSLFTSYSTIGRLIYDMNDATEFEKEPFEVEIRDQSNILSPITVFVKTAQELFSAGMSRSNYIIHDQGYYMCKPGSSINRGAQKFIIFTKF